jgi:glycosyltransferase involved in cell wall biosynthesis
LGLPVRLVTIVIPAMNEAGSVGSVVEAVRHVGESRVPTESWEVLVVDDGSTDGTAEEAERAGARVVRHPHNLGNGAAVKAGLRNAGGEIVVLMDADGQHDPADIPRLLDPLDEGYDMVVGARRKGSGALHRNLANGIYNLLASYVTARRIPDLTSGFRAMRTAVVRRFLYLLPNTFSYPTTITLSYLKAGHPVTWVPIEAAKRVGRSKIRLLRDGSRFFLIILRITTLFSPFKVFFPLSLATLLAGAGYYLYTYLRFHRFTNFGQLLLVLAVILFALSLISEQIAQLRFDRSEDPPAP